MAAVCNEQTATEERTRRREAAWALLEKPKEKLSPEERRVAGLLHYGEAKLEMFRVFNSASPPGPARERLHELALSECRAVVRILGPLAAGDPHIDDVGMMFWTTNSLAEYYLRGGAVDLVLPSRKYRLISLLGVIRGEGF